MQISCTLIHIIYDIYFILFYVFIYIFYFLFYYIYLFIFSILPLSEIIVTTHYINLRPFVDLLN